MVVGVVDRPVRRCKGQPISIWIVGEGVKDLAIHAVLREAAYAVIHEAPASRSTLGSVEELKDPPEAISRVANAKERRSTTHNVIASQLAPARVAVCRSNRAQRIRDERTICCAPTEPDGSGLRQQAVTIVYEVYGISPVYRLTGDSPLVVVANRNQSTDASYPARSRPPHTVH